MSQPSDMTVQERIARAIEALGASFESEGLEGESVWSWRVTDYLDEAARIARMTSGWISVEDQLPEPDINVFVMIGLAMAEIPCHYGPYGWFDATGERMPGVIYWHPRPYPLVPISRAAPLEAEK